MGIFRCIFKYAIDLEFKVTIEAQALSNGILVSEIFSCSGL